MLKEERIYRKAWPLRQRKKPATGSVGLQTHGRPGSGRPPRPMAGSCWPWVCWNPVVLIFAPMGLVCWFFLMGLAPVTYGAGQTRGSRPVIPTNKNASVFFTATTFSVRIRGFFSSDPRLFQFRSTATAAWVRLDPQPAVRPTAGVGLARPTTSVVFLWVCWVRWF
jgi:hypothetical protein